MCVIMYVVMYVRTLIPQVSFTIIYMYIRDGQLTGFAY